MRTALPFGRVVDGMNALLFLKNTRLVIES